MSAEENCGPYLGRVAYRHDNYLWRKRQDREALGSKSEAICVLSIRL